MNVKNNKRRRESQEKIEKAFIELLQTREIKDIRVSDLIKMTELNRSTFYANYIDIFDLADKTKEKLENATKIELEFDSSADEKDQYERYLAWIWVDDELLQNLLVQDGLAETYMLQNNYKYAGMLQESEEIAKK